MSEKSKLNILSLRQKLQSHKDFLRALRFANNLQRKFLLDNASRKQLLLLHSLIAAFVDGHIGITKKTLLALKATKKYKKLTRFFVASKASLDIEQVRAQLLNVAAALPILLKYIVKRRKHEKS